MNIVIDLEMEEVIADFNSRVAVGTIEVKSQDTPIMAVYFVQRGTNYDLGPSPGIRFGLFEAGNPNPLVLCSTFTRVNDQTNRVCYRGYPNFNTVNLAGALGQNATLAALGEWRYQTSGGTISRTQDVSFTIQRVLLSETILDATTAAFTVPAVGSNVTIAQGSTGWLSPGLGVSIGAGAGNYTVVSITDGTHFVAQNKGGAGNAAPGTVIPSGTSVGIAPVSVLSTYPDPSTIELLPHKGAVNGYAGLDANRLLTASSVPVDGQTIVANANGKIALQSVLATVAANFTTPAANATVSVTLNSTSSLVAGQYVRIPIAGYYIVSSITSGTVAVLQNNGDPFNAVSGTTITAGAVVLPAQAATSGSGTPGQNAFTTTLASFTVPATGATVNVNMGATAWLGGSGYVVFIAGAGYYAVSSVPDATHAILTNLGYAATNAAAGATIPTGAAVSPGGLQGPASTAVGANAYDTTGASFTMPAAAASVNVTIGNTSWLGIGQEVFIAGAGYFSVASIVSPTIFSATNSNYPGAAAPGSTIASGARVSPAGVIGPQGAGGAGLNAFTTLSANFTQPTASANVTATVGTTAWMVPTQVVYVNGGGYYSVASVTDLTHVSLTNLGYAGNAAPGATVTGSGTQGVTPAGLVGPNGVSSYTTTTAAFTMPASGASVTIALATTAFIQQNQNIFVAGAGYFVIASIIDSTHVAATNLGASGNVSSGTVIASGSGVTTAGAIGPTGAVGPTGPSGGIGEAPTDGQIYGRQNSAWVVAGGGGGGPIYPSARIFDFDDFDATIISQNANNGKLGWYARALASGSIASSSNQGANATDKAKGVWNFTGSTTGDWASISLGDYTFTGGAKPTIVPALGILQIEFRINIGALPTGSQDLEIDLGLVNNATAISSGAPNDGIWFRYWFGNAITNWQCKTVAGGTATNTSSGVAATAGGGQWHKFQILTNAGWTSIQFKIDGTVVATNTTNVPTNNLCPFMRVGNLSSVTWASNVYVDYYFHDYEYAR